MVDLSGQVMLVTGGSRGIGEAIVRKAAGAGARVCFTFRRDETSADRLCAEIGTNSACAIQADAADPDSAAIALDAAARQFGPVTLLVNNAGITGRYGPFHDLPPAILRHTFEVNVFGPLLLAQEAIRRWRAAGSAGRIVNISSIAATLGAPNEYVHYAATKAAIDAFTIGLGKELAGEGIRVNAVAPGTALTGIHAAAGVPDRPAQVAGRIPMQRVAQPDEIADAVLWLLCDEASYVTGTILRVAGGT